MHIFNRIGFEMQTDREQKYKEEIALLKQRLLKLEDIHSEVLNYAEMAIVDTRADMRIISSDGAVDTIFKEGLKYFERGESLLTVVQKSTHNNKPSIDNVYQNSDEIDTIEDTVRKFVEGTIEEKMIRIVGEKENGELFLLLWSLKRKEAGFKSFFRIIPTNSIIQATKDKQKIELESMNKIIRDTLSLVEEGVVILSLKNEIEYMNNSAKRFFFAENSNLLKNAPVEGRYFQEILVNEAVDDVRNKLDLIQSCVASRKPGACSQRKNDSEFVFKVYPMLDEKRMVKGTIMIIKDDAAIFSSAPTPRLEMEKLQKALKHYSGLAKRSESKIEELEHNQKWLMNQNNEFQSALRSVYSFLENLPAPVSIISLPSRKFDFVNTAFLKKFNCTKENAKGKTDDQFFSEADAEIFSTKNLEAIDTLKTVKVSTPNYYAKQIVMVNANQKPTHILRVFN